MIVQNNCWVFTEYPALPWSFTVKSVEYAHYFYDGGFVLSRPG